MFRGVSGSNVSLLSHDRGGIGGIGLIFSGDPVRVELYFVLHPKLIMKDGMHAYMCYEHYYTVELHPFFLRPNA